MTLFISNYTTKFLRSNTITKTKTSSVLGRDIRERGDVIRQCVAIGQRQRQGRLVLSTSATSTSLVSSSSSTTSSSSSSSNGSNSNSNSNSSIWDVYNDTVHGKTIRELPEVQFSNRIKEFLIDKINSNSSSNHDNTNISSNSNKDFLLKKIYKYIPSKDNYRISLKSIFITFIVNKNARIAAVVGKGYYTIGPCGEENLSIIGSLLLDNNDNENDKNSDTNRNSTNVTLGDSSALHYRHTSISLTRQLLKKLELDPIDGDNDDNYRNNNNEIVQDLLLGRARGYTVSKYDPITGGVHCSIGAPGSNYDSNEYIVSSTLASQCPSAIGRALGYSLNLPKSNQDQNQRPKKSSKRSENNRPISFVTLGDGSIHNSHFLSSVTLAKHTRYQNINCPIVFGISDNGLSISYKTNDFLSQVGMFEENIYDKLLLPVYHVENSNDMVEIYSKTKEAFNYSRIKKAPCIIIYKNLIRRFGHASTDRQYEYLTTNEIHNMEYNSNKSNNSSNENNENSTSNINNCNVIQSMIQAVDVLKYTTYQEIYSQWIMIEKETDIAFSTAMSEPKVSLDDMMGMDIGIGGDTNSSNNNRISAPLTPIPIIPRPATTDTTTKPNKADVVVEVELPLVKVKKKKIIKKEVMRKHMTRVIEELMEDDEYVVYLGEDVRHGGYYLITDGIYKKFGPKRIIDFPPDETTLLGCALGFSQLGILPIVEIPYIKYFDCGIDIFYEIAIQYWLTNGNSSSTSRISIKSSSSSTIGEGGEGEGKFEDDGTSNNKVGGGGGEIRDEDSSEPILPKRRNGGMIIRLQGFDRGVFGGNFHTHNCLSHIPPGVDVVCYSNGPDYVRGMRYAHYQAKYSGRIIVFVDCTYILNLRHVHNNKNGGGGGDREWEFPYPSLYDDGHDDHDLVGNDDYNGHDDYDPMTRNNGKQCNNNSMIDFDQVIRYRVGHEDHPFIREEIGSTYCNDDGDDDDDDAPSKSTSTSTSTSASINDNAMQTRTRTRKVAIVTYGNGVVTSLQARKSLLDRNSQDNVISISKNDKLDTDIDIDIIDCPYLSDVPKGLENIICDYDFILFADICKEGPGSNIFSSMITTLQQKRKLLSTSRWQFIGAPRTYNPLGSTVTFLNQDRIEDAVVQMLKDA